MRMQAALVAPALFALTLLVTDAARAQPRKEVEVGAHGGVLIADETGTIFGINGAYRIRWLKLGGVIERIDVEPYRLYWSIGGQIGFAHRSRSLQVDALAEAGVQLYDDVPVFHRARKPYIGPRFSLDWVIGNHFEIGPWLALRFAPEGGPAPPTPPGAPSPPGGAIGGG